MQRGGWRRRLRCELEAAAALGLCEGQRVLGWMRRTRPTIYRGREAWSAQQGAVAWPARTPDGGCSVPFDSDRR